MSTSSSSDDENDENIREAVDPVFFSDDLFQSTEKAAKEIKKQPSKVPPSLRCQNQPTSTFNPLEIRVTPEFRAHVSKHLKRLLDELIDDTEELPINKKKQNTKTDNGSIKLLRNSESCIKETYREVEVPSKKKYKKKKRRKIDSESSSDDEARAKEVAVSADWILSGKATEGWAPNTRGELEIITIKPSK